MRIGFSFEGSARSAMAVAFAALFLTSCAQRQAPPAPPPVVATIPQAPPANAQPDMEAVWHVRSALNVGALSCRGQYEVLAGQYNRLLDQYEGLLAQAYKFEESRLAVNELDRHLTQLYNHFANQRSPQNYCQTVQTILARALAADDHGFSVSASLWLTDLEQAL